MRVGESENALFGVYFYSGFWDSIVDYKIFGIDQCKDIRHCMIDEEGNMVISLYEAQFATLNVLPEDLTKPMNVELEFRLINRL